MKKYTILLCILMFSCAHKRSIIENISATVQFETEIGYGNGVIVDKKDSVYKIITVAHICDFTLQLLKIYDAVKDEKYPKEIIMQVITFYLLDLYNKGGICSLDLSVLGKHKAFFTTVDKIDFNKDLLLASSLIIGDPIRPVFLNEKNDAKFNDLIYGVIYPLDASILNPLVLFGNVGNYVKVDYPFYKGNFLQTQLVLGQGASGSPAFLENNELLGIFNMVYNEGVTAKTRASFMIPVWEIRKFLTKKGPKCVGNELKCAILNLNEDSDFEDLAVKIFDLLEIDEETLPSLEEWEKDQK